MEQSQNAKDIRKPADPDFALGHESLINVVAILVRRLGGCVVLPPQEWAVHGAGHIEQSFTTAGELVLQCKEGRPA